MNVFLSYSVKDKDLVNKVRNILVHSGVSVFDDKEDISVGETLSSAVSDALDHADAIIFFISKSSSKSEWFNKELSLAISNRYQGKGQRILPVVLDTDTEIPFFINDYLYLDLSKTENFDEAINKLIKSLLKDTKQVKPEKELIDKRISIELERKIFELKKLEYEVLKIQKSRQLYFVALIATLFSITGVSIGFLHGFAKVDLNELNWLVYVLLGAASSVVGAFFYMKKEEPRKNEFLDRIRDIEERVREMEVRHEQ